MLFYQVELIKHGHDTCLEFMEFAASGDYAETQAHFHSTMEITVTERDFSKAAARSIPLERATASSSTAWSRTIFFPKTRRPA